MVLYYSSSRVSAVSVQPGPLATGLVMVEDLSQPGQVRLALAGSLPVCNVGELLSITFEVETPSDEGARLISAWAAVNEVEVPVRLSSSVAKAHQILLPIAMSRGGR